VLEVVAIGGNTRRIGGRRNVRVGLVGVVVLVRVFIVRGKKERGR
jgi:hypothetical protein